MDQQAASLLATLKRPAAPSDTKLNALNALKSDIKHYRVPDSAQATVYECIRLAITQQTSASLAGAAFSTLGHLIKRLKIQDPNGVAIVQLSPRLYPAIVERLGDPREQIRMAASSALSEMWPFLAQDVEKIIREEAIGGGNPRAKEAGMVWVVRMHNDENMPFKSYVGPMVAGLEEADGTVRDAAKSALIELFRDAPERAKLDLKRQLKAYSVRHATETQILAQIGFAEVSRPEPEEAPRSRPVDRGSHSVKTIGAGKALSKSTDSEAAQPTSQESAPMDPLYVHSERELNDLFRDMVPHFEGKETEQNWVPRDKSVLKIRQLLAGNAPQEYHQAFMAGIKNVLEGVLKVSNSLRTTMSTNGCQAIQELTKVLGPAMDHHVEILLQTFIKMSSATKHIAAENGRITTDAVLQHCTYHVRMLQHIWGAAQEKNAQLRSCTPQWLSTVLRRQAGYKAHFETSGGLELAEKCIRKGLDDANPKVKEAMRAVYWMFASTWPVAAESIISKLDPKSRSMLERDSNNPNAALFQSQPSSGVLSRSTTPHGRTALKEMMAEQRRAKSAARGVPDRPTSAMATTTPVRARGDMSSANRAASRLRGEARVASNTSTSSATTTKGSLMSGPVRRPRKPEIQRPLTADPYAGRRMLRPETPSNDSVGGSPPQETGASKSSIPLSSSHRGSRIPTSRDTSPVIARRQQDLSSSLRPVSRDGPTSLRVAHEHRGLLPAAEIDRPLSNGRVSHSRESSRTLSDVHHSPLKAMFDAARAKADRPISSSSSNHFSHAPVPDPFQDDQVLKSPPTSRQTTDVAIYEDPDPDPELHRQAVNDQGVLSELPINENRRLQSPVQSPNSSSSSGSAHMTIDGNSALPSTTPSRATNGIGSVTPKDRAELMRNKKLLISGIERIRSCTIDAHGFRRVQEISKSTSDIWDGGERYEELMAATLAFLATFEEDAKLAQLPSTKANGLKSQGLGVVRALLTVHPKYARPWYDRALITVISCRKQVANDNDHLIAALERAADEIVRLGPTENCIDAMLEHLNSIAGHADTNKTSAASTSMSLTYLRLLVAASRSKRMPLGRDRTLSLARIAATFLDDDNAEVRKTDVDYACEVYGLFNAGSHAAPGETESEATAEFWQMFKGVPESRKGLLTYYVARSAKQQEQAV